MFCPCKQSRSRRPKPIKTLAAGLVLSVLAIAEIMPLTARPLDEIIRAKRLNICVQEENLPFSSESPQPGGVFLDLGKAIAWRLGVEAKYTWVFSAEYVRKTDCDLIPAVASLPNDDPIRQTSAYMAVRSVLVAGNNHTKIRALDELRTGHIAVLAESLARHVLNMQGYPLWVRFLTNDDILDAVEKGEADAGVVPLPAYQWYIRQHPGSTLRVEEAVKLDPAFDFQIALGLRRADTGTVQRFNEILRQMRDQGVMAEIFARYNLSYEPPAPEQNVSSDAAAMPN